LKQAGAENAAAVQIGGPSGQLVGPEAFDRHLDYDDLATGGAVVVFGPGRDLVDVVSQYLGFFVHESCGYCTPCRVGNVLLKERVDAILRGRGEPGDLEYLGKLAEIVKTASRCGLGQTSPNPVSSSLKNFRGEYEKRLSPASTGLLRRFDFARAVAPAAAIAGRPSEYAGGGTES
jgi:[NiFe] hydrogenase diaphorase moiety large subunit